MEIRSAEVEDFTEITNLEFSVYGQHGYNYIILRQLLDLAGNSILIAKEEHILGFIIAAKANNHKEGWIMNLLVDPEYRKKGIAFHLISEVLTRLQNLGRETIYLTIAPSNVAAHYLYSKLGFSEDSFEKDYSGPGKDRLVMRKSFL